MICQECKAMVSNAAVYHPYLYCELFKLGHHNPEAYLASYGFKRTRAEKPVACRWCRLKIFQNDADGIWYHECTAERECGWQFGSLAEPNKDHWELGHIKDQTGMPPMDPSL